ncbi:hypothetical protein PRUPE_3G199600, partial [Prunus persica]
MQKLKKSEVDSCYGGGDVTKAAESSSTPKTPIELAIDSILHDFEMPEGSRTWYQSDLDDLDTDRDGFICLDEFNAFWVSGSKDGDAAELRDAFDLYDQDRNGLISANELHLVLNQLQMTCSLENCNRMIKTIDADGDGNVNFEEFKKMMGNNAST